MAILDRLVRWVDLNGVATRGQGFSALSALVAAAVLVTIAQEMLPGPGRFAIPVLGAVYVVFICTMVRRLHDGGLSGYWSLMLLVPVLALPALLVILLRRSRRRFADGHPVARIIGTLGLAVLFSLFCLRTIWAPFWIPAESMKPALLVGDFLLANQFAAANVQRGDVVVFRHPVNGAPYIKRLIGMPGDKVQMQAGLVSINGQVAPQVADGVFEELMAQQGPNGTRPRCQNDPVGEGGLCTKSQVIETLPGGPAYRVLNIDDAGFGDSTEEFMVPAGHYFFLGDNRDNSLDSRYGQTAGGLGFVPADAVIGRADRIVFSAAGRRLAYVWTWRSDRFFKAVE